MILGVALLPFPKKTAMDLGQPAGRAVLPLITRHQHGPATRIDIHKMIAKKRGWQPPRWGKHHMLCYILYVICYIVYSYIGLQSYSFITICYVMLCHAISCYIVNCVQIILAVIWSRGYFQASEIFYEFHGNSQYPLVMSTVCYWKWPFIVDFPIKNGDFPLLC